MLIPSILQVGNQQFAFAFQHLVDLSYLWTTSTHLNVTNATLANGAVPADEVRLLNDTATVVRALPNFVARHHSW